MKKIFEIFPLFLFLLFLSACTDDETMEPEEPTVETLTDIDGNEYETVIIGNQTWMTENLKTQTFNDGTAIPEWMFGDSWHNLNNPQEYWQWAGTGDLNNVYDEDLPEDYYGAMYNEMALSSGKLAPEGWRIPTVEDYMALEAYLNANGFAGNEATALKSTFGWADSNLNGTNEVGFNGFPNGYVAAGGTATGSEVIATYATSNTDSEAKTRTVVNLYQEPTISYADNGWALGAGVRCIKE